jgi:hypothetical protein
MVAFPYLDGDSLAFDPYPASGMASGSFDPPPVMIQRAVSRNRELVRRAAEDWVRRSPENAAALDSLASWAEVSGGVAIVGGRQAKALDIARHALERSADSTERARLAVSIVRLLVKNGDFAAARAMGDSVLRSDAVKRASDVPGLSGVAALLGRAKLAVEIRARESDSRATLTANGETVQLPSQLADSASALTTQAALGIVSDATRMLARRVIGLITSYFPEPARATQVSAMIVGPALTFLYPLESELLAQGPEPADETSKAYRQLSRGDSAGARSSLRRIRRISEGKTLGTSIDGNFRRARLALALGDTTAAFAELDPVLRALPTLGPSLLSEITQASSVVRAFALRADLAAAQSDQTMAAQCARDVVELWKDADQPLQPVVSRMRALIQ